MALTCASRHTDGTPCQEQDPRHTVHHAHDRNGANCRMWVDSADTETRISAECDWLPVYEVDQRAVEIAAMINARGERILAAIHHPARHTADTLQWMQESTWFIRLTGDEHDAFATVRAALERIANEDLGADGAARKED